MADRLVHRGPDDAGVWADEARGVALAQRRLSIVDLSAAGHQPMHSHGGRYVIVFNGEIYNHREMRLTLEPAAAGGWRGQSDTEVLLAAIDAWGIDGALDAAVGMFAFALWDRAQRRLTLARDRLGEKPLYYGHVSAGLAFGSELKAIRALTPAAPTIDRGAVALFLRHGYVPTPHCIYRDFRKVEPGCYETFEAPNQPTGLTRYWSALAVARHGSAAPLADDHNELADRLNDLVGQAVRGQMVADVPVGAFLSGGIDSSTVTALMQAQSVRPVKTFTIGFADEGYDEAAHARAVARHLGTDHTELCVTPLEAMSVIPLLPGIYDEPFADSSQIPTFLVSQLARCKVTVSLSGDGGDELFGGYNRYLFGKDLWHKLSRLPTEVRAILARMVRMISAGTWSALMKPVMPLAPSRYRVGLPGDKLHKLADVIAHPNLESLYLDLVSQWQAPNELVLGAQEPTTLLHASVDPAIDDPVARMMLLDLVTYLPDDILVKVDRAAMAVSLETRVPLLDHRVVEFAWQVPMSAKVNAHGTKQLLRSVLRRYVPDALIDRPKMGFGVPIDKWLRGPLRDWAEALLDPTRLKREGYLNPEPIRVRWQQHLSAQRDWHYPLWNVLMFQAWLEQTDGR
jgi:asparagine synthase (glutamine-hydrolysing)